MFKKSIAFIAAATAHFGVGSVCQAEVIPPHGPGQIGWSSAILCESLTVHSEPSLESDSVTTLRYGDHIIVTDKKNGWAQIATTDDVNGAPVGWVNTEYIVIDPAWYRTDDKTYVYAWNDTGALKVAQLGKDVTLPVLKEDGDWLIVSLRGATGWIHKTDADRSASTSGSQSQAVSAEQSKTVSSEQSGNTSAQENWFPIYGSEGTNATIHHVEGSTYEDANGRSYTKVREGYYHCSETGITFAESPYVWVTSGSEEEEDGGELTGADYGENQDGGYYDEDGVYHDKYGLTGADYGENQDGGYYDEDGVYHDEYGLTGADYGENEDY